MPSLYVVYCIWCYMLNVEITVLECPTLYVIYCAYSVYAYLLHHGFYLGCQWFECFGYCRVACMVGYERKVLPLVIKPFL